MSDFASKHGIAIIGMACRFPGARTPEAFWNNLAGGVESIQTFTEDALQRAGIPERTIRSDTYVPACGALDDVKAFDASFFELSPREATAMDPQQRLFLETAWQAVERAGYDTLRGDVPIGLFAGAGWNHYLLRYLAAAGPDDFTDLLQYRIRNDKDFLATLTSYKLNLRGPSLSVQTACSSSLVGTHLACQSLRDYECDVALAGGINVNVPARHGYSSLDSVFSPDGHCRAFDAEAKGTVPGSGVGIVVLKRLRDALDDGDHVHAVIRGTAVNNDGRLKAGYTAPSVDGQAEVIATAQALADVDPATISYVEAHGTATPMGDPIEVEALTQAFRLETDRTQFCRLGSVKSNVGHLDAAAGVAGLIKTVLALEHAALPPTLHYRTPNPRIDFTTSPFLVNASLEDWAPGGAPRRAGVSAFGVGGTNAHIVLEQAPPRHTSASPSDSKHLFVLSAKSRGALETMTDDLADHIDDHLDDGALGDGAEVALDDVSHTLWSGRARFAHRRAVVAFTPEDAVVALRHRTPDRTITLESAKDDARVAFLYPGLGNQHENMGRELYRTEPAFRQALDRCASTLRPHLDADILDVLYPHGPWHTDGEPGPNSRVDFKALVKGRNGASSGPTSKIHQTRYAQPIQFSIEYALASLWASWGVESSAAVGHSIGEYVAACRAGVFSLDDALHLVAARAKAISEIPGGAMLAVSLPEAEVEAFLNDDVFVSALNTPSMTTLAGQTDAIDAVHERLQRADVTVRRIQTTHAFHTPMMAPAAARVSQVVSRLSVSPPSQAFVSNVTGTWIRDEDATDPDYWARHLCRPVRFYEGIETLMHRSRPALLEVGPGQTLGAWARQNPNVTGDDPLHIAASLPHENDPKSEQAFMLKNLGTLWAAGLPKRSETPFGNRDCRRTPLPTYPFERSHFDLKTKSSAPSTAKRHDQPKANPARSSARRDRADRFEVPVWRQLPPRPQSERPSPDAFGRSWLVFVPARSTPLLDAIVATLNAAEADVLVVREGLPFDEDDLDAQAEESATCRASSSDDVADLVEALRRRDRIPSHVIFAWAFETTTQPPRPDDEALQSSFFGLLHLAQALGDGSNSDPICLTALTHGAHAVLGADVTHPAHATLIGPCAVARQELDGLHTQILDVVPGTGARDSADSGGPSMDTQAASVLADCVSPGEDLVVARRAGRRWTRTTEPISLPEGATPCPSLREEGVYLLVGGLGAIGHTFANWVAASVAAPRLVLTGRHDLPIQNDTQPAPPRSQDDATERRLQRMQALTEHGADVDYRRVDVTDADAMSALVDDVMDRHGRLDGVVHAAGVSPGGLMRLKDDEAASQVLAPKVAGTHVFYEAVSNACDPTELDFILFSSSLHALAGGVGTVDHTAANAYQDAFAHAKAANGVPITSVNWAGWASIGQAARAEYSTSLRSAFQAPDASPPDGADADVSVDALTHPLLTRVDVQTDRARYVARVDPKVHWVAADHRLQGTPVLPGTATLDVMAAAVAHQTGSSKLTLRNVQFLQPVVAPDDAPLTLRLDVPASSSQASANATTESVPNAQDEMRRIAVRAASDEAPSVKAQLGTPSAPPEALSLDALRKRCDLQTITIDGPPDDPAETALSLGPRWTQITKRLHIGHGEVLCELTLGDDYRDDVEDYPLHPALLDAATGLLQALEDDDLFLPLSYAEVRVYASLPAHVYSHLTITHDDDATSADVLTCDVVLCDEEGGVLVEIEEYTMRRVRQIDRHVGTARKEKQNENAKPENFLPSASGSLSVSQKPNDEEGSMTLTPEDGADAFQRLLCGGVGPNGIGAQVAVSPVAVSTFIDEINALHTDDIVGRIETAAADRHDRPDLGVEFVAPRSALEEEVADVWSSTLGVRPIGVHDNFFDLGGDSLLATRMIELLSDRFNVDVLLRTVFDAPTVADMSRSVVTLQARNLDDTDLDALIGEL